MTTPIRHAFRGGVAVYQWWIERWDDRCIDCGLTRRHATHQGIPAWTLEDVANLTRRVRRMAGKQT